MKKLIILKVTFSFIGLSFCSVSLVEGYRWYWVIAFSSATGNGDLSDVCMAIATPLPA